MTNVLAVGGPNSKYCLTSASPAGFLAGLWHGLICPITFIVSLFSPGVRIYEISISGVFGGSGSAGAAGT